MIIGAFSANPRRPRCGRAGRIRGLEPPRLHRRRREAQREVLWKVHPVAVLRAKKREEDATVRGDGLGGGAVAPRAQELRCCGLVYGGGLGRESVSAGDMHFAREGDFCARVRAPSTW